MTFRAFLVRISIVTSEVVCVSSLRTKGSTCTTKRASVLASAFLICLRSWVIASPQRTWSCSRCFCGEYFSELVGRGMLVSK
nr:MAG TPA: hypothetical protein [Caudoviricetes sp.]